MSYTLSETQGRAVEALIEVAKEDTKAEALKVRENYETTAANQLVENLDISKESARDIIRARYTGQLSLEDVIYFRDGSTVNVSEILDNWSLYDKKPCADPVEPEEGASRAMFFANNDTGNPLINSMLHGGQVFYLSSTGSGFKEENESPIPFIELIELADILEPGDTAGVKDVIQLAGDLDPIEEQELLRHIKKSTGMTMEAMRSFLKRGAGSEKRDLDHLAIARKVIEKIRPENILSDDFVVFIWKNTGVWEVMDKGDLQQRVQRELEKSREVMSSWVDGVTKVLINEVYRPNHEFNTGSREVINCLNGELHLNKESGAWELKSHDREAYRTSQIPITYNPDSDSPRFKQFLTEIFVNEPDRSEKVTALLEMFGYSMVAHCKYEKFIILIGAGANGKSVLLSILEELLGPKNTVGVQPSQFDNRFQRAHLRYKLANIVTEIRQGEVIADAELKGIVSGEPSTVENKFKDPFTMRPYATCWFATNHMPHTRDFSEALFRRALILKFNRVFDDSEKDTNLKDVLIGELPGILNLSLDAYSNAVINGFTKPSSSESAKAEWRLEADQVQQFIEECCAKEPWGEMESSRLYSAYRLWAGQNGIHKTLTQKSFRDRLTRLGFGSRRDKHSRYVTGVGKGNRFPSHI